MITLISRSFLWVVLASSDLRSQHTRTKKSSRISFFMLLDTVPLSMLTLRAPFITRKSRWLIPREEIKRERKPRLEETEVTEMAEMMKATTITTRIKKIKMKITTTKTKEMIMMVKTRKSRGEVNSNELLP